MQQSNSSISGSDPEASTARADVARTAAWFVSFLVLFEICMVIALDHTQIGDSAIGMYFRYGESYEGKLRRLAHTPNLPSDSILYAGWIDRQKLVALPDDVDLTIYGSSFALGTGAAILEIRPQLKLRTIVGPGAPLNHTYAMYQIDRTMRKTRVAIVSLVSIAVGEVLLMNRGSLYADLPFPYFFPRYDVIDGKVERVGESLINSAAELTRAIDDPKAWAAQREVLAQHDAGYRKALFDTNMIDYSAVGRLLRRSLAKQHQESYLNAIHSPRGFNRGHQAVAVFRALLRQMISDLRAEGVKPIVVSYSTLGYSDHLDQIIDDIVKEERVPHLSTVPICPPSNASNYNPDGHFTRACDFKIATEVLKLLDGTLAATHADKLIGVAGALSIPLQQQAAAPRPTPLR